MYRKVNKHPIKKHIYSNLSKQNFVRILYIFFFNNIRKYFIFCEVRIVIKFTSNALFFYIFRNLSTYFEAFNNNLNKKKKNIKSYTDL
jgi:hypothetical protein